MVNLDTKGNTTYAGIDQVFIFDRDVKELPKYCPEVLLFFCFPEIFLFSRNFLSYKAFPIYYNAPI